LHLTDEELHRLHLVERGAEAADAEVDTTRLSLPQLVGTVSELWRAAPLADG
jgi:hypothetical protein